MQLLTSEQNFEIYQQGRVWCERNLIRHPLALLSRSDFQALLEQTAISGQALKYEYIDEEKKILRSWEVRPDIKLGYPGPFDKDVLITVQKLVTEVGFPPPNPFPLPSLRSVCETMNIQPNGTNIQAVKKSLKRIASTVIETNAFYLKDKKQYWEDGDSPSGSVFTLWSVYWRGKVLPNGEKAQSIYLFFNPPFYSSLLAFFVQPLDYEYYMGLPPLAKRIYELQAPKFFGLKDNPYTREEYGDYCKRLPIEEQPYFSLARRILDRAHNELVKTKFFSHVVWGGSSYKKPWIIMYYPGARAKAEALAAKTRTERFGAMQRREQPKQLPLLVDERSVQIWVEDIYHKLEASNAHEQVRIVKNTRFYKSIARAAVRGKLNPDRVREFLSETFDLWNEGRIKKTRSAYFTDLLKRHIAEKGKDLKQLLREA